MIWSITVLAASMRTCRSSRDEEAYAVKLSRKQTQREAIVFFISRSFPLRSPGIPARMVDSCMQKSAPRWSDAASDSLQHALRETAAFSAGQTHRMQVPTHDDFDAELDVGEG